MVKKRILFTSNVSWAMVKFRFGLLKALIQEGYDIYIVAPFDEFVPTLKSMGCHCLDIRLSRKGVNPIEDMRLLWSLFTVYRTVKPDLIFHYSIKPIIYGSIAAAMARIPSIAVNIGLGYTFIHENFIAKISRLLYKIALYFPREVWFINEDDREEFIQRSLVDAQKTFVLPSEGVNTDHFLPQKRYHEKQIFLLIARVLWDKGVGEYYEAAKALKSKYPQSVFQLLGPIDDGNPKGIVKAVVEQWHQEGMLEYLGYASDVRDYIASATCIVLPSYREGKGMTLIEAGCMEKPLIATNVPGCKDIVKDGYNGFLCEVRNSQSLAKTMEKMILLDEMTREKFGKNSRIFMEENFDVNKVIEIYNKAILKL